jgi:NADH:ubiquinone oxidoreductase subunit H
VSQSVARVENGRGAIVAMLRHCERRSRAAIQSRHKPLWIASPGFRRVRNDSIKLA